jgi:DeoR family transcriptional regulator of aga operon
MVKQAKQVIVAADSSKLGKVSPAFVCLSNAIHILITDTGAAKERIAEFELLGTRVILV